MSIVGQLLVLSFTMWFLGKAILDDNRSSSLSKKTKYGYYAYFILNFASLFCFWSIKAVNQAFNLIRLGYRLLLVCVVAYIILSTIIQSLRGFKGYDILKIIVGNIAKLNYVLTITSALILAFVSGCITGTSFTESVQNGKPADELFNKAYENGRMDVVYIIAFILMILFFKLVFQLKLMFSEKKHNKLKEDNDNE